MLEDAAAVAAALAGTVPNGRPVVEIPVPATDEVTFGIECGPHEVEAVWQAARAVLAVTGRWPLVVRRPAGGLDEWAATQAEARRQLAEMRYATGDHSLGRPDVLTIPTPEVALADRLAALPDEPGGGEPAPPAPPALAGPAAILLLPVANGWDTLAHVDFLPNGGMLGSVARLVAVVRSWHERFGAELVANWSTALQFVVSRPPRTGADARRLALEHAAVAPSTRPEGLVGRGTWILQSPP